MEDFFIFNSSNFNKKTEYNFKSSSLHDIKLFIFNVTFKDMQNETICGMNHTFSSPFTGCGHISDAIDQCLLSVQVLIILKLLLFLSYIPEVRLPPLFMIREFSKCFLKYLAIHLYRTGSNPKSMNLNH